MVNNHGNRSTPKRLLLRKFNFILGLLAELKTDLNKVGLTSHAQDLQEDIKELDGLKSTLQGEIIDEELYLALLEVFDSYKENLEKQVKRKGQ